MFIYRFEASNLDLHANFLQVALKLSQPSLGIGLLIVWHVVLSID